MKFKKILVGINNSPLSPVVFAAALEQAQLNKAALKLLHCIAMEMMGEPMTPMPLEPSLQPNLTMNDYQTQRILIEQKIEEAQAMLERYCQEALNQGVPTEADYQVGEAGNLMCEAAKEWEADLIVVGRQGRSGLAEVFLGSVSNYVVHHAPCSVLVIQEVESQTSGTAVSNLSSVETNPTLNYEG